LRKLVGDKKRKRENERKIQVEKWIEMGEWEEWLIKDVYVYIMYILMENAIYIYIYIYIYSRSKGGARI
jgi:hypothetical protein